MLKQFDYKPGHKVELVPCPEEYGGKKVACSCGWSRTVGISDNYQLHTLAEAARHHVKTADPFWTCHCGHEDSFDYGDENTRGCPQCGRVGAWMPYA